MSADRIDRADAEYDRRLAAAAELMAMWSADDVSEAHASGEYGADDIAAAAPSWECMTIVL